MFTIAYSLIDDFDIHYSINTRLEGQRTLVAELKELSGNKYNISVFALMDGLPFIRAAAKSKSITISNLKGKQLWLDKAISNLHSVYVYYNLEGVTAASKRSSSIHDCLLTEDSTSDDSNTCISCSLKNTTVGTCVVIVHTKPSLLRNSYRGLQDISIVHLNMSTVDGRCSGCIDIDGVSLNDNVIVVFSYLNGTIVSNSHVFVRQRSSSDTGTRNTYFRHRR